MAFVNPVLSVYQVRSRHRNEEVRALIPADFAGVMVLPVRTIARELHRSEKAVWRESAESGVSAKCLEGYTVTEVFRNLHISHRRLRIWFAAGWIKVGRNRRVTERSLRAFLREHTEEVPWDRLDTDGRDGLLEFGIDASAGTNVKAAGRAG